MLLCAASLPAVATATAKPATLPAAAQAAAQAALPSPPATLATLATITTCAACSSFLGVDAAWDLGRLACVAQQSAPMIYSVKAPSRLPPHCPPTLPSPPLPPAAPPPPCPLEQSDSTFGSGNSLVNGNFVTETYAGCCRRCQARSDCGAFYWSNYYLTCTLYPFDAYTIVSGGWWQSVGVIERPK